MSTELSLDPPFEPQQVPADDLGFKSIAAGFYFLGQVLTVRYLILCYT
jgi:hypothetical protein